MLTYRYACGFDLISISRRWDDCSWYVQKDSSLLCPCSHSSTWWGNGSLLFWKCQQKCLSVCTFERHWLMYSHQDHNLWNVCMGMYHSIYVQIAGCYLKWNCWPSLGGGKRIFSSPHVSYLSQFNTQRNLLSSVTWPWMETASPALLRIQVQKTEFSLSVHLTDTDKLPCSSCSEREANAIFRSGLDFGVCRELCVSVYAGFHSQCTSILTALKCLRT